MMLTEYKFEGGRITLRDKGEMFDQKTGRKNAWERGIKIFGGKNPITLDKVQVLALLGVLDNPEVVSWIQGE